MDDGKYLQKQRFMTYQTIDHMVYLLALAVLVGCARSDALETAPVRGVIMLDGMRYTQGGSVVFQPESQGKMATGVIQSDGSFELSTYSLGDGAALGKHRVIVLPPVPDVGEDEAEATFTSPIPKKFRSPATSSLVCEVKANITNEIPIHLESK